MIRCSLVFQNKNSFAVLSNKKSSLALSLVPTMTILSWCYRRLPHWIKWITMRHLTPDCSQIYFSFRVLLTNDLPSWCHPHFPRGQDDRSLLVVSSLFSCLCVRRASPGWWVLTKSLPLPLDLKHSVQGPGVCIFASPMPHLAERTLTFSATPGCIHVHGSLRVHWRSLSNEQSPTISSSHHSQSVFCPPNFLMWPLTLFLGEWLALCFCVTPQRCPGCSCFHHSEKLALNNFSMQ